VTNVRTLQQTITTTQAQAGAVGNVFCSIQITQWSADGGVTLPAFNPVAYLSVSSFQPCTGMWKFRLTVKGQCGSASESYDDFAVNVRCNAPPVAVAACNTTIEWKGTSFEQVRLDGRGSGDRDSNSLTYEWTFPPGNNLPGSFCPLVHKPCVESFCQQTGGNTLFTDATKPSSGLAFSGASSCAPTVYRPVYDSSTGFPYRVVSPTQTFVGNSAYFTPTTKGTYRVRLTVGDGCSLSISEVDVVAICPTLSVSLVLSENLSTFKVGKLPSITVGSSSFYAGDSSFLTYQWSVAPGGKPADQLTFSNSRGPSTSAEAKSAGLYNLILVVNDNCQTVISTVAVWQVVCNTPPTQAILGVVSPAPKDGAPPTVIVYDGTAFPQISLNASSTDAEADAITFAWTINGQFAGSASVASNLQISYSSATQAVLSFKPPATGGVTTYVITAAASDGCSTSMAGSITLTLQCLPGLQASAGRPAESKYDYTNQKFPDGIFSAADTVWPYKGVARSIQSFFWTAAFIAPGQTSGSLITSGFQGETTDTFRVTPTNVGTYLATLTIADGCAQSTAMTTLSVLCDGNAAASVAQTAVAVSFNSFIGAQGGFPDVTIDGSSSTSSSLATLTYNWMGPGLRVPTGSNSLLANSNAAVLSPVRGTTMYTLTVRNGPCAESAPVTITVTATCGSLSALLQVHKTRISVCHGEARGLFVRGARPAFPATCFKVVLLQAPGSNGFASATYSRTVT
jgi:hypothetical protein